MRELDFSDGFSSASVPSQGVVAAMQLRTFVNDAAYVTAKAAAAAEGDIYAQTTGESPTHHIRYHDGTAFRTVGLLEVAETFTGQKTFSLKVLAKEGAGGGLDAAAAGNLEIGASTATEVKLGKVGAITRVMGDLVVDGTTVTLNVTTVETEDQNILVNKNGNDVSAEGAGITVQRAGTFGSFIYAAAAASKFKLGGLGSEVEVADISTAQTLTNKVINAALNTITNITDAMIAAGAAIARTKLASGTANHVLINDASGVMSSEALLAVTRGGTGLGTYAAGDLITATGASTLARLAAGTNTYVLTMVGGVPAWAVAGGGGGSFDVDTILVDDVTGDVLSADGNVLINT